MILHSDFNSSHVGTVLPPFNPNFEIQVAALARAQQRKSNPDVVSEEIKKRLSHPFVERLNRSIRAEYLDQPFYWNAQDLERKLTFGRSISLVSAGDSRPAASQAG